MVDKSIVNAVKNYLEVVNEYIPVHQGVIFGSHAAGRADYWSDIDLLVISKRFDHESAREDINLLWRIAARADNRIEPIPVGLRQFENDDSSAILEIARREGQVVEV